MEYRMLELVIPPDREEKAREIIEEEGVLGVWSDNLDDGSSVLRVLLERNKTEALSDGLTKKFSSEDEFRIMLFAVEATVPQPKVDEEEEKKAKEEEKKIVGRISREELYSDVSSSSELNFVYLSLVLLSTLVAGVGLVRDDVAVIIGAMVIAPLLGPNVSMALSATLADMELGWRSLKANLAGIGSAFALAFVMGILMNVEPESQQIINKTTVNLGDITIALAAGSAGVLAYTRGVPAAIVGVMVAVALLPPLVNVGLLLGAGYVSLSIGSMILTFTNLICINLAGILTFVVQGVRPRNWWEAKKAKRAVRNAIAIWTILLIILGAIIWYWNVYMSINMEF